ncbi:MAG: ABC transporter permease [Lachnospiraceae bacterium]|nr:ABC transporter permease [Lachnospiraceae bacterium]
MKILLKTTLKLLFRNLGFWFFLIVTPTLSVLMLNIKVADNTYYSTAYEKDAIVELEDAETKVAYYNNGSGMMIVKVYDASGSELSEYFLNRLVENGMFKVCRVKAQGMDQNGIEERLKKDGYDDRMGAVIYVKSAFDEEIRNGNSRNAFTIYLLSDDERCSVLESEAQITVRKMINNPRVEALKEADGLNPEKEVINIYGSGERSLTKEQGSQKTVMGYVFAFLTLGFVFCGVFVAHTVIQEQKEQVFTRIKLTNAGSVTYFISKFLSAVIVSGLLTSVLGIMSLTISEDNIGMSRGKLMLLTFMLGLIFCSISLLLGILLQDVMSSNVAAFTIWSMSSLLSGLYFPLNGTSTFIKVISSIMPQKWFLDSTEMIFVGDNLAYVVVLCITIAYMTMVVSLGSLGLKLKKAEA